MPTPPPGPSSTSSESPVASRPLLLAGAVVLAAGGVVAAFDLSRRGREGPGAGPVAAALDARLREARAAVNERARTLTEMPLLAHAVATDEATVRDLTGKEIGFRPRAGEALEIAQIDVATKRVATLLRLPAESPTSPFLETPGDHAAINGGVLYLSDVRDVIPSDPGRAREVHGALAVTTQVELSPVLEALGGGSARLELGGAIIALGPVGATDR